jgi:hypothetical protein
VSAGSIAISLMAVCYEFFPAPVDGPRPPPHAPSTSSITAPIRSPYSFLVGQVSNLPAPTWDRLPACRPSATCPHAAGSG